MKQEKLAINELANLVNMYERIVPPEHSQVNCLIFKTISSVGQSVEGEQ